jgi:glycosyltransferase involved in cell wall biosynthesis
MKISVCVATYNGSKYITEQIESVLDQIGTNAEVIVVDDASSDETINKVLDLRDARVKIHANDSNIGYIRTFQRALERSSGEYIFLCDQDDIWPLGRVDAMIKVLEYSKKNILVGDFEIFDEASKPNRRKIGFDNEEKFFTPVRLVELLKMFLGMRQFPLYGSNMLIRKSSLDQIIPFPNYKTSHDIWISLVGFVRNDIAYYNKTVTFRRIHSNNATNRKRFFIKKIYTRLYWISSLFVYFIKKVNSH